MVTSLVVRFPNSLYTRGSGNLTTSLVTDLVTIIVTSLIIDLVSIIVTSLVTGVVTGELLWKVCHSAMVSGWR